jgi:hypothetical protein
VLPARATSTYPALLESGQRTQTNTHACAVVASFGLLILQGRGLLLVDTVVRVFVFALVFAPAVAGGVTHWNWCKAEIQNPLVLLRTGI